MSTSFTLSPGYQHDGTTNEILECCKEVNLDKFAEKMLEYGVPRSAIEDLVDAYREIPSEDMTIIYEDEIGVMQVASGGGEWRDYKEAARRAFGILALDICYKKNLAVNFTIQ